MRSFCEESRWVHAGLQLEELHPNKKGAAPNDQTHYASDSIRNRALDTVRGVGSAGELGRHGRFARLHKNDKIHSRGSTNRFSNLAEVAITIFGNLKAAPAIVALPIA
jgi:hypothetical protein